MTFIDDKQFDLMKILTHINTEGEETTHKKQQQRLGVPTALRSTDAVKRMESIRVQLQFGCEYRLITIVSDDRFTFLELQRLAQIAFPQCQHGFSSFIYVDDDHDRVTVSSEREMVPLRAFYARLCAEKESLDIVLALQAVVNRNHANLTLDPVIFSSDDRHQAKASRDAFTGNVDHLFASGQMLSLELFEIIGSGNSGIVRRCRHRLSKELLAVKIISLDFRSDTNKHEIVTELNALNTLQSDYIVRLHGAYLHEHAVHICTEYMDHGSLEQYVGLFIPEHVLIGIASAIIHGLTFMWTHKIMHRDIKPSNILINSVGDVKLCDFGVSRILETIGQKVATFVGTGRYMAPERLISDVYSISSEIWSFGMTILEMGLGCYPFPTASHHRPIDLLQSIVDQTPTDLPVERGYSSALASLIRQCLSKNEIDRPSSTDLLAHPLLNQQDNRTSVAQFFNRSVLQFTDAK
jgi:mitogen-activated protein kinase kinase 5